MFYIHIERAESKINIYRDVGEVLQWVGMYMRSELWAVGILFYAVYRQISRECKLVS